MNMNAKRIIFGMTSVLFVCSAGTTWAAGCLEDKGNGMLIDTCKQATFQAGQMDAHKGLKQQAQTKKDGVTGPDGIKFEVHIPASAIPATAGSAAKTPQ